MTTFACSPRNSKSASASGKLQLTVPGSATRYLHRLWSRRTVAQHCTRGWLQPSALTVDGQRSWLVSIWAIKPCVWPDASMYEPTIVELAIAIGVEY